MINVFDRHDSDELRAALDELDWEDLAETTIELSELARSYYAAAYGFLNLGFHADAADFQQRAAEASEFALDKRLQLLRVKEGAMQSTTLPPKLAQAS